MKDKNKVKRAGRSRRHMTVRNKVHGTGERPRLSVYRSLKHIHAQIINDDEGETLVSASSLKIDLQAASGSGGKGGEGDDGRPDSMKIKRSKAVGKLLAEKASEQGISKRKCFRLLEGVV